MKSMSKHEATNTHSMRNQANDEKHDATNSDLHKSHPLGNNASTCSCSSAWGWRPCCGLLTFTKMPRLRWASRLLLAQVVDNEVLSVANLGSSQRHGPQERGGRGAGTSRDQPGEGKPKKDQARSTRNERQGPQGGAVAPPGGHKAGEHKGATDARGTKSQHQNPRGGRGGEQARAKRQNPKRKPKLATDETCHKKKRSNNLTEVWAPPPKKNAAIIIIVASHTFRIVYISCA